MIICPKCKEKKMYINHTFRSVPVYVCESYGWDKGKCSFVIPVNEYEEKYGKGA